MAGDFPNRQVLDTTAKAAPALEWPACFYGGQGRKRSPPGGLQAKSAPFGPPPADNGPGPDEGGQRIDLQSRLEAFACAPAKNYRTRRVNAHSKPALTPLL